MIASATYLRVFLAACLAVGLAWAPGCNGPDSAGAGAGVETDRVSKGEIRSAGDPAETAASSSSADGDKGMPSLTQEGTNIKPVALRRVKSTPKRLVAGDEIDKLESRVKPERRFESYQAKWHVETRTFSFRHYNRTVTKDYFQVVMDGKKVVAVLRSGDIMLVGKTPDLADTKVNMPVERLHLDNLPGPSLPTYQFIKKVQTHGSIYKDLGDKALPSDHWEVGEGHLTYVRKQTLPDYEVEARFTFTVDPVYGYRLDAVRDVYFNKKPEKGKVKMNGGSFCPGCYVPWEHASLYDRTAWTPAKGGIEGWANNLVTMDRCDSNKKDFVWRDGGFIAYLPGRRGWSPCFTRMDGTGDTPRLALCNAHNDFHIKFIVKDLPRTDDGRWHFRPVHRLVFLPPEMTAEVWDKVDLIQKNARSIIIKIGDVEDFEDQPVSLTEPARGLVWTSGAPDLVKGIAHSGKTSLKIEGRQWPNLPQVSLKPSTRYRLEGWMKVEPWSAERIAAEKAKDARRRQKLREKGRDLPPEIEWDNLQPRAYIRGDFYEWSPYSGKMLEKHTTSVATDKTDKWQHVTWEFTSPDWGPFINISFHADQCTAYLDDFALREIDADRKSADRD